MIKMELTHETVVSLVKNLEFAIKSMVKTKDKIKVYPVPRGGVPVAYLMDKESFVVAESPKDADFIIDDIVDGKGTYNRYGEKYPNIPFLSLINKERDNLKGYWIVFPWENSDPTASVEDSVVRMLQYIGENPNRQGLLETPKRVVKAWEHWFGGYDKDPNAIFKTFEDGAENYDQMIVRKGIPLYSFCEHHIAPIIGECTIAYIPSKKIIGLSKLDRLVDIYARRLQVQERLTTQIADTMMNNLDPLGVGVWIKARHLCIESRGVKHQNSDTYTLALRGCMLSDASCKAEFMSLAK